MDYKTSRLNNVPETNFLGKRPRENDLQTENLQLIKENNYLHSIIDRMTKALLDARPERNSHNVLELFTVNQHEIGRFPDVFLHQFEFLDPLFELYEEKTRKLELSNNEFQDKLLLVERTFEEVVNFYKNALEEKDKKILNLFTEKFENDDPNENADFFFHNQILRNEQKEYTKLLFEEKLLQDQLTQDLSNKLGESKAEYLDLQEESVKKLIEFEKLKEILTKSELKIQSLSEQTQTFRLKNEEYAKTIIKLENRIIEQTASMHKNEKEYILTKKKIALQVEEHFASEKRFTDEIKNLKLELKALREKDKETYLKLQETSSELLDNEKELQDLNKSVSELEKSLKNLQEKSEKDDRRVSELSRNEESLKRKEKSNEELIYKLSSQSDQAELSRASLEKKLIGLKENHESELLHLTEENYSRVSNIEKKYRGDLEKKEEEILKLQSEMYSLKVTVEKSIKENGFLKANMKEMINGREEAQKTLIEKNRLIKELRMKMNSLDDDLNRRVLSMTFEKNSLESTIESFKGEIDSTSDKIKSLNGTINNINSEKNQLRCHIENLMKDKQELVAKIEAIRRKLLEKYEDLIDENFFKD